jgi:hypothetical protein
VKDIVHHKNGNKADNRPDNLSLETRKSHMRTHGKGRILSCAVCGAERWHSPARAAQVSSKYTCRKCRDNGSWHNGRVNGGHRSGSH